MKHIGIRFADNDFWKTLNAFMEFLVPNAIWNDKGIENLTKERIVELFNKMAPSLYWLKQNGWTYHLDWKGEEYLTIETKNVFVDAEVWKFIEERNGWDNGEFQWVDLETGQISTI